MSPVLGTLFIVLGVGLYFLPWIVASRRGGRHVGGIALLNLFLGWLVIPWLGLLVWAMYDTKAPKEPETPKKVEVRDTRWFTEIRER